MIRQNRRGRTGQGAAIFLSMAIFTACSDDNPADTDDSETYEDTDTETDTGTSTESDSDTDTDTGTDTGTSTETDTDTGTGEDTDTGTETESDSDSTTDTDTDTETAPACVFYVAQGAASGDGTSWDTAFLYVQDGIDAAVTALEAFENEDTDPEMLPRCEVWVSRGYYLPPESETGDKRDAAFHLEDRVDLYGGFTGTESLRSQRKLGVYETVLSGDLGSPGNDLDNAYHVVVVSGDSILDGFTITDGKGEGAPADRAYGGGILVKEASVAVRNCRLYNNRAADPSGGGGAIAALSNATVAVSDSSFENNASDHAGGALYIESSSATIDGCQLAGNVARDAGGAVAADSESEVNIADSHFEGNRSDGNGGAISVVESPLRVTHSRFERNVSEGSNRGGAIYFRSVKDAPNPVHIDNCAFLFNAALHGGALYTHGSITNVSETIFQNNAARSGPSGSPSAGAIYATPRDYPDTELNISRSTFLNNRSEDVNGVMTVAVPKAQVHGGVFIGNYSENWPSTIEFLPGELSISSSTFVRNNSNDGQNSGVVLLFDTGGGGGRQSAVLTNSILWFNGEDPTEQPILDRVGGLQVTYSNVQNWPVVDGSGNLDENPLMVGGDGPNDLFGIHLDVRSPCIDSGDPDAEFDELAMDMDGNHRLIGGRLDMGADENVFIYVDNQAEGKGDGTRWVDAYLSLQEAFDKAGTELWNSWILVAEGTYVPEDALDKKDERTKTFVLNEGGQVFGGFKVGQAESFTTRDWVAHKTILSGNLGDGENPKDNAYHVVVGADGAVLDGIIITGGRADSAGDDHDQRMGGGMFNEECSPIIRNTKFVENFGFKGAAIYNRNASPEMHNAIFVRNSAGVGSGGAVAAELGSHPALTNCTLASNHADVGGALYMSSDSMPVVTNSILWGNGEDPVHGMGIITYCDVEGGCAVDGDCTVETDGNMDADPLWEAWSADYSAWEKNQWQETWDALAWGAAIPFGSPCIDAGNDQSVDSGHSDYLGEPRPHGNHSDMGAVELQQYPSKCTEVQSPAAQDGHYTFYYQNDRTKPFRAYCSDMGGESGGAEYLSFVYRGGNYNFSAYYIADCKFAPPGMAGLKTSYDRIRLFPDTLEVDTTDNTFATNTGVAPPEEQTRWYMEFGQAVSCSETPRYNANVNLKGTPFKVIGLEPHTDTGSESFAHYNDVVSEVVCGVNRYHEDQVLVLETRAVDYITYNRPSGCTGRNNRLLLEYTGFNDAPNPSGNPAIFGPTGEAETFVVPAAVHSITIGAYGAQGGGDQGGLGAFVEATYAVTPGQTLNVFVGTRGTVNNCGAGGGGGGTMVWLGNTLWIAAGGGGGQSGTAYTRLEGVGGSDGTSGTDSPGDLPGTGGSSGRGGSAGNGTLWPNAGSGGAGWISVGGASGSGGCTGGQSKPDFRGGASDFDTCGSAGKGGFGGGGGASWAGGGGGGYSGGGGGSVVGDPTLSIPKNASGGGGGGSYIRSGATVQAKASSYRMGNGFVTIAW